MSVKKIEAQVVLDVNRFMGGWCPIKDLRPFL